MVDRERFPWLSDAWWEGLEMLKSDHKGAAHYHRLSRKGRVEYGFGFELPLIITSSAARRFTDTARRLIKTIHTLSTLYPTSGDLTSFAPECRYPIGRPDLLPFEHSLRMVEQNATGGIGGFSEVDCWRDYYRAHPVIQRLARSWNITTPDLFTAFESYLCDCFGEGAQLGILDLVHDPTTLENDWESEQASLLSRRLNEGQRIRVWWCTPDALTVNHNGVYLGDVRLDGLYSRVSCIDYVKEGTTLSKILEVAREGRVRLLHGPLSDFTFDKGLLSLLFEKELPISIPDEDLVELRQVVPWTTAVAEKEVVYQGSTRSLVEMLTEERERFVVKFGRSFHAREVFIGREISQANWSVVIEKALSGGGWIVQEYVESPPLAFPILRGGSLSYLVGQALCSPYVLGRHVGGFLGVGRFHSDREGVSKVSFFTTGVLVEGGSESTSNG